MNKSTCTIDGCENSVLIVSRGLCRAHYNRWQRHGDPLGGKPSPAERFWAKVNKGPECWDWVGCHDKPGYGVFNNGSRIIRAHRHSYELAHGPIPSGMLIDHICHNPPCVNPGHLRLATHKQNNEHRRGHQVNNKGSGVRGVHRNGSKWSVRVGHNGEVLYLGSYATVEEAEAVAIESRRTLFTHSTN